MIISNSIARPKLAADPSVLAQFSWMGKCHLASNSDSNSARQLCGRGKLFITSFIQFSFAIICIFTYFPLLFFFHSISFHDYDSFFSTLSMIMKIYLFLQISIVFGRNLSTVTIFCCNCLDFPLFHYFALSLTIIFHHLSSWLLK